MNRTWYTGPFSDSQDLVDEEWVFFGGWSGGPQPPDLLGKVCRVAWRIHGRCWLIWRGDRVWVTFAGPGRPGPS